MAPLKLSPAWRMVIGLDLACVRDAAGGDQSSTRKRILRDADRPGDENQPLNSGPIVLWSTQ